MWSFELPAESPFKRSYQQLQPDIVTMNGICPARLFLLLLAVSPPWPTAADFCTTLYLLHVVPFYTAQEDGWDRGLEVVPAGHLAAQHVNGHPQLLNGLQLKVIDVPSEPCAVTCPYTPFVEVMGRLSSSQQKCVFGVIGLYCSSTANLLVPPLSHQKIGYIQLSAATSPLLRNLDAYPYLFGITASSESYNIATIEMMRFLKWTKISVVFDYPHFFFQSTGRSFSKLVEKNPNLTTIVEVPLVSNKIEEIEFLFDELFRKASRIMYLSVTIEESGNILCEAYKRRLIWPWYAYIFVERTLSQVLSYNDSCTSDEMKEAVEGVFFLQTRLSASDETILVSRKSFQEYHEEYQDALRREANEVGMHFEGSEYANTLYDQVWAVALAINSSFDRLNTAINKSYRNAVHGTITNRRVLSEAMHNVSFQGATGTVRFDKRQEVQTVVNILQARNGSAVTIGSFDSYSGEITLENFNVTSVPPDTFVVVHYTIHHGIGVVVLIHQLLLLCLVLVSTVVMIYWRNRPEIKSTSLNISFVILAGCLFLCTSPIFHTVINVFETEPDVHTSLCVVDMWFSFYGITLIMTTLLFRLLRIDRIFRSYHSTGKYCSDIYLLLYICVASCGIVLILVLWEGINSLHFVPRMVYQYSSVPPYFLEYGYCSSDHLGIWLVISFAWVALLMIFVAFLAIQTRKIKRKHFKDTKKVNAFIFITCLIFTLFVPLSHILQAVGYVLVPYIIFSMSYFMIVLLCQIFLFLPKYVPLIYLQYAHRLN